MFAPPSNSLEAIEVLLDRDAKIDVETAKGETLLHITPPANQDCLDILKTALKEGMSVSATSSQGWTPLHQAVYTGTGALGWRGVSADLEAEQSLTEAPWLMRSWMYSAVLSDARSRAPVPV
jgi:ankyrin repeat protein